MSRNDKRDRAFQAKVRARVARTGERYQLAWRRVKDEEMAASSSLVPSSNVAPQGSRFQGWESVDISDAHPRRAGDALPTTFEEFEAAFPSHKDDDTPSHQLYAWAIGAGTTFECRVCGALCIAADDFAAALADEWQAMREDVGQPSDDARWEQERRDAYALIVNTDVDLGGWNSTSMCNYHDAQEAKDRQNGWSD